MNIITFPELGFRFRVSKIAFTFLGVDIYSYAICIVLGILIAVYFCLKSEDNYYIKRDCLLETLLYSIVFGIFGARLYYVIFNIKYYLLNPMQIFNIRDGGLAIYGALIVGICVIIKMCKKYREHPLDFLDYIAPFVALAQCIGRWGNFFNIEAFGYETTSFLRMRIFDGRDFIEVHPIFLYESIANLIIFIILRKTQSNRKFMGQIFYGYLVLYSGVRMFLEPLRVDSLMFFGYRISQVLSVVVFLSVTVLLSKKAINYWIKQFRIIKRRNKIEKVEKCQSKNNSNGASLLTLV